MGKVSRKNYLDSPIERLCRNLDLFLMSLLPFGEKVRMRGVLFGQPLTLALSPFMGRGNLLIALNLVPKGTESP
ncbi:MAG: hypothetical protein COW52_06180 [Nitrospirae bacterium CG17_big_fil_post_rev_8_21_14_2_50_50_9]|nr:MAG: hypothetical protein COW52_06180 [Nitrospirae bacterium CG17_big_fil_post_rev_8_21_14_2_50_50_9]PIW85763.1 MAG: hypothetical protein COZ95_02765 [Nitrospirae bacterium CG_4_8_14_3_um_filter_50_41]